MLLWSGQFRTVLCTEHPCQSQKVSKYRSFWSDQFHVQLGVCNCIDISLIVCDISVYLKNVNRCCLHVALNFIRNIFIWNFSYSYYCYYYQSCFRTCKLFYCLFSCTKRLIINSSYAIRAKSHGSMTNSIWLHTRFLYLTTLVLMLPGTETTIITSSSFEIINNYLTRNGKYTQKFYSNTIQTQ